MRKGIAQAAGILTQGQEDRRAYAVIIEAGGKSFEVSIQIEYRGIIGPHHTCSPFGDMSCGITVIIELLQGYGIC